MGSDADFVGSIPEQYDRGLGPMIFVDTAADLAARTAAGNPARVLEIAAGTGIVTRALRDALPAATRLTATDINPPMLAVAAGKFTTHEDVTLQPADAMALPFEDASFDAVVCQCAVMFFPDKGKSFSEVFRVLTPGGRYLFNAWDSHRHNAFGRISHEVTTSFFDTDPPQFQQVPFSYHQIDPAKEALLAAGFRDFRASLLHIDKPIPDPTILARGIVYGSPLIDQIRQRGNVDPEAVFEALVAAYRAEFGSNPGVMRLQAIVFEVGKPA